ncbi:MAG TPA: FKBP-type peptidyl-prolyl cis-trans isomerase [Candidatus Polarisedimenticolia bacterium]|nr:FKBP-type peptidyl-prolyl cis-trans isomerase [Candidatus Polarisedimenticolia bacterium]
MNRRGLLTLAGAAVLLGLLIPACMGAGSSAKPVELKTDDDKTMYALGLQIGGTLAPYGLTAAELEFVKKGFTDAAMGTKPEVDQATYGPKVRDIMQAHIAKKSEAEKTRSQAFLATAAKETGAQSLPSGLVYTEMTKGTGATPAATDTVKVNYRGTLVDGTEFDSSYKRNEPVEFPLNGVIPCWTEGLQKMAAGGKSKLICPSSIAYGDNGRPPVIPGGATLIFEVELLEVKGK